MSGPPLLVPAIVMVGVVVYVIIKVALAADRTPVNGLEFWMSQALEKDLELQRVRLELAIQTDLSAKTRHALQQFTKLCAERHISKP